MRDGRFTLLVVDDAEVNLRLLQIVLEDDYDTYCVDSGTACLSCLSEVQPDLVLLDVMLPDLNGHEVCRRMKSGPATRDIPIIFVSAAVTSEERLAGYEAGGDEYVTKPFDIEELIQKIESSLDVRRQEIALKGTAEEATQVAKEALIGSSELGTLNNYVRRSAHAKSYKELSKNLFEATRNLGLNCSVVLHTDAGAEYFGCAENSLEAKLLEKFHGAERFADLLTRTVVNASNCSILVKNMPVDDTARYGRLKDHLAAVVDATESRIESLELLMSINVRRDSAIRSLICSNDEQLASIQTQLADQDVQRRDIMMNLLVTVENQLLTMGLDDDQEHRLVKMLDEGVQKVDALPNIADDIAASFQHAKQTLNRLLDEQPVSGSA